MFSFSQSLLCLKIVFILVAFSFNTAVDMFNLLHQRARSLCWSLANVLSLRLKYRDHYRRYLCSPASRKEESCCFPGSPLDVSFAPPQTSSKGSLCIHSLWLQETHARILACAQTLAHAGTNTLVLYIQTESSRVFWAVTNRPTRVWARGLSSLAKWSTTHSINQLPSGYGTQIKGQKGFKKTQTHRQH